MKKKKDEEIVEAMAEDKARGKKGPISLAERRRRRETLNDLRRLLEIGDEEEFMKVIRALKPTAAPEEIQRALQIWRENRLP